MPPVAGLVLPGCGKGAFVRRKPREAGAASGYVRVIIARAEAADAEVEEGFPGGVDQQPPFPAADGFLFDVEEARRGKVERLSGAVQTAPNGAAGGVERGAAVRPCAGGVGEGVRPRAVERLLPLRILEERFGGGNLAGPVARDLPEFIDQPALRPGGDVERVVYGEGVSVAGCHKGAPEDIPVPFAVVLHFDVGMGREGEAQPGAVGILQDEFAPMSLKEFGTALDGGKRLPGAIDLPGTALVVVEGDEHFVHPAFESGGLLFEGVGDAPVPAVEHPVENAALFVGEADAVAVDAGFNGFGAAFHAFEIESRVGEGEFAHAAGAKPEPAAGQGNFKRRLFRNGLFGVALCREISGFRRAAMCFEACFLRVEGNDDDAFVRIVRGRGRAAENLPVPFAVILQFKPAERFRKTEEQRRPVPGRRKGDGSGIALIEFVGCGLFPGKRTGAVAHAPSAALGEGHGDVQIETIGFEPCGGGVERKSDGAGGGGDARVAAAGVGERSRSALEGDRFGGDALAPVVEGEQGPGERQRLLAAGQCDAALSEHCRGCVLRGCAQRGKQQGTEAGGADAQKIGGQFHRVMSGGFWCLPKKDDSWAALTGRIPSSKRPQQG